ncbi:hypothetical protein BVX98_07180 [bacterium F11]|nr:hypothetical protein BVX98_07180 [bacterium F11]
MNRFHPYRYQRRQTREVKIGLVGVGGSNPIRVQSMTTTPTMDTQATVGQIRSLVDVGCEIVRLTVPTVREAHNLENIKNELTKKNTTVPLVADIHFRPDAALIAADMVEKVRINPGNFVDSKAFKVREYSDEQYQSELNRLEDQFVPLLLKLQKQKKALRIGTNHGSLSDRILNRHGDTPLGMVESALEFARICQKYEFHDLIFSMKASSPRVMISAYRLLVHRLDKEGWDYPMHLGVTEAGDGEDGRIKSTVGIGGLLEDGIGDTIRVSLTEDPEFEIPVAKVLAERYSQRGVSIPPISEEENIPSYVEDRFSYEKRRSEEISSGPITIGGSSPLRVLTRVDLKKSTASTFLPFLELRCKKDTPPEILEIPYYGDNFFNDYRRFKEEMAKETDRLSFWISFSGSSIPTVIPEQADGYVCSIDSEINRSSLNSLMEKCQRDQSLLILRINKDQIGPYDVSPAFPERNVIWADLIPAQSPLKILVGLEGIPTLDNVYSTRALVTQLKKRNISVPIVLYGLEENPGYQTALIQGSLICDGIGDVISVSTQNYSHEGVGFSYNLLQACGSRLSKTEFVSCPSCGRTLFDLQTTTERIKSKTGHLKGVKIAIMGCIVNGPGEMADADFGYVGGGPGKINLYVGKTCVQKSIPSAIADEKLIELIKKEGKWVDP